MKFAIIGAGNSGKAATVYLTDKGQQVTLYDRNAEKVAALKKDGITSTGVIETHIDVNATESLAEAVKGADYIMLFTLAAGHRPVARQLKGLLEQDQVIVIFNGDWGAVEFAAELGAEAAGKNVAICETGAQIFLSSSPDGVNSVNMKSIKNNITLACTVKEKAAAVVEALHPLIPQLLVADNVLFTSINNSNPIIHAPVTSFNICRMENGEDYTFYGQAASRGSIDYVCKIDKERLAVAEAVGIEGQPILDIINSFWPDKHDNLFDALTKNKSYIVTKGPTSLSHRYITEDVPFGIVPIAKLARRYGVKTPYLDAIINVLSLYLDEDFMAEGPDFEEIDVATLL